MKKSILVVSLVVFVSVCCTAQYIQDSVSINHLHYTPNAASPKYRHQSQWEVRYNKSMKTLPAGNVSAEQASNVYDKSGSYSILQLQKDKPMQALVVKESVLKYFLVLPLCVLFLIIFIGFRIFANRQALFKQQLALQLQHTRELEKDRQLAAVGTMLKGQEEEWTRLAKDLHDGVAGMLSGVKFSLMNMKSNLTGNSEDTISFERSLDMLDTSIQELRRVAHNIMPAVLVKFGLNEALKDYCDTVNNAQILDVKYQSFGMEKRIENTTEIIVYRIIQELLNNIFKHARADEVLVQLIREEERVGITVEDNGKGFDIDIIQKSKSSGWANIMSRVNYLRGKLDIISGNKGTSVNIEVYV